MADNVGNADARPDLELEEEYAPDEAGTIDEQEMAEAEAGCEQTAVGVPMGHPGGTQRHGGARAMGFRPGGGEAAAAYEARTGIKAPRIIAWEITRSCNLSCVHCRASAEFGHYAGELSLDQIKATIDDIVTITNPIIILTGGEPLMRPDIWDIIDYAQEKGAMPVIGTNATLITEDIAAKMAAHKIPRISVSVDFPTADEHDAFRGQAGCFDKTIEGIKIAKRHGLGGSRSASSATSATSSRAATSTCNSAT
jgi:sulfatase maturation enzyme AslB (radical SAM superfamily)